MIIKIHNKETHRQEAEITLNEIRREGWVVKEFIETQKAQGRYCMVKDVFSEFEDILTNQANSADTKKRAAD